MPRIYLYYTYRDSKNDIGRSEINLPYSLLSLATKVGSYATSLLVLIDNVTKCQVTAYGFGVELNIGAVSGLKSAPISGSDVEEGGKFVFKSATGGYTSTRIPGFDETFVEDTSRTIPLTATPVSDLVTYLVDGETITGSLIAPSDNRGSDITSLYSAKESFQHSCAN
jgi:hypothetical protein